MARQFPEQGDKVNHESDLDTVIAVLEPVIYIGARQNMRKTTHPHSVMAARSVALLGARVIVTGVRPEVARTFVELGTDLQGIETRATLRSGIASALSKNK